MSTAIVASSSSAGSSKASMKGHAHKTRVVRRRGRGRMEGLESDDEIERAAMSDGSDTDDTLESDMESDSDVESTAQANGHINVVTPSTTQSPPPHEPLKSASSPSANPSQSASSFFTSGANGDWSEMVAEEGTGGTAELPVIDFADMGKDAVEATVSSKTSDGARGGRDEEPKSEGRDVTSPGAKDGPLRGASVRGSAPKRALGHAVRQQYQQRLQTDPSFVPTVGEFWGHDPRLIPEGMRSMSDWWRDRKFARGRGRGMIASRGFGGRGRGGSYAQSHASGAQDADVEDPAQNSPTSPDVASIDRAWTHDGFEEMKRREDKQRTEHRQNRPQKAFHPNGDVSPVSSASRGGFGGGRGRGGYSAGRGGFYHRRGSFAFNNTKMNQDRIWFSMKPERIWTKQLESFLHFDNSGKPWSGKPSGFRVHIPGRRTNFVKVPTVHQKSVAPAEVRSQALSDTASATEREKTYVVRLPNTAVDETDSKASEPLQESFTTVEEPVFDVSPVVTTSKVIEEMEALNVSASSAPVSPIALRSAPPQVSSLPIPFLSEDTASTPSLSRENSVSELSVQESQSSIPQKQGSNSEEEQILPTPLPSLQTTFPNQSQPSPTYTSQYGYPPQLPPGVALNHQGYPYELASGRPVFLQPTPPPVPIFNPRPMPHHNIAHGVPFVPGHMHHASLPPDFMPMQTHTPPVNGYETHIGAPLFTLPRQNSRIEIRAPSDANDGVKPKGERKPSGLRNSTVNSEASANVGSSQHQPAPGVPMMYSHIPDYASGMGHEPSQMYRMVGEAGVSPIGDGTQFQQPSAMDPNMMGYGGYPQYYYPEYSYPSYMPPGQYDPYAGDSHQSTVYY